MINAFMIDLETTELSPIEKEILQNKQVGAVLLFSRNFKDRRQLISLISSIRSIRPDILLASDHEGGYVQRFQRHGFRSLPAARTFGAIYDISPETESAFLYAYKEAEIMAEDLIQVGINFSLGPVLDLQGPSKIIGTLDRAFHHDPHVVAKLAESYINGMHGKKMPTTGKHFPGHGSCTDDSHLTKPTYKISKNKLFDHDLVPFRILIEKRKLDAIMPAHVIYSDIDPHNPVTYSKRWLTDILRDELGFDGLVISDCLGMEGADIGNLKERAFAACEAGCDMLIVCNQSKETLLDLFKETFKQTEDSIKRLDLFHKKAQNQENKALSEKIEDSHSSSLTNNKKNYNEQYNSTKTV